MSIFTRARDAVTGAARDVGSAVGNVAQTGLGLAGGLTGLMTGGLTGSLGGMGAIGGLMGLLGGGMAGGMGGGGFGGGGSFGSATSSAFGQQPTSLMDMLGQQYQQGPVSQTGTANLSNQGLV